LLNFYSNNIIGITGPPGAGKSTLTDALISCIVADGKSVAVLCIDPSSPFHFGAVLGDRIRMSEWYNNPKVYIRSLASRGSMGGLHPKILEICELVKTAAFDYIIIETVGVGQSEIEIAGLADITMVVLVPESGDEIQTMKAGLMEIADIFVVNKSDRPGADAFVRNLRQMLAPVFQQEKEIPIVQTVAADKTGIDTLYQAMLSIESNSGDSRKNWLLAQKAYYLIAQKRMMNNWKVLVL
jgi:LAO/AO transport system kinase